MRCAYCRKDLKVPAGYRGPIFCGDCFARKERNDQIYRAVGWSLVTACYFVGLWLIWG